nr:MAG TPA: hypothetical protein [Caudoviricetes sp.]
MAKKGFAIMRYLLFLQMTLYGFFSPKHHILSQGLSLFRFFIISKNKK